MKKENSINRNNMGEFYRNLDKEFRYRYTNTQQRGGEKRGDIITFIEIYMNYKRNQK